VTYLEDGDVSRTVQRRRRTGSRFVNNRNYSGARSAECGDRDRIPGRLDPLDDLDIALHAIGDFGQWIQNADTKAGMCGALLGLMIAGVTSDIGAVHATLGTAGPLRYPAVILLAAFAGSLFVAGVFLGLTQMPRVPVPPTVRRLAFPAMARGAVDRAIRDLPAASAEELREEAWDQAEALARIAARKFRYLRMGLVCSGLCTMAFLGWLGLSAAMPG
jgi:Pycsar effector protein